MIRLTRINGKEFILNCELIKSIESTSDTVITLTQGEKIMVKENAESIVQSTVRYRQLLNQEPAPFCTGGTGGTEDSQKSKEHPWI